MDKNNRQESIELYLQGKLEGQSLHDFEQQLKVDKTLQEDVTISKDVEEVINEVESEELFKENLLKLGGQYVVAQKPKTNATSFPLNWGIIILVVVVLAVVGYFFWQQQNISNSVEPEQIFASYYEPYPSSSITRSNVDTDEAYQNAIKAYNNEKYSEAIEGLTTKPADIPTQLLLSNCYLKVSPPETQKAIEALKSIAEGDSDLYSTTANWYLALAYLQNNQENEAKAIFKDLSQNGSNRYANLAKKILAEWK